jgi:hypothetical protein
LSERLKLPVSTVTEGIEIEGIETGGIETGGMETPVNCAARAIRRGAGVISGAGAAETWAMKLDRTAIFARNRHDR